MKAVLLEVEIASTNGNHVLALIAMKLQATNIFCLHLNGLSVQSMVISITKTALPMTDRV